MLLSSYVFSLHCLVVDLVNKYTLFFLLFVTYSFWFCAYTLFTALLLLLCVTCLTLLSAACTLFYSFITIYAVHFILFLLQRFIEPLLFGRRKKKRTVEEALESMEQKFERNISELNTEVVRVRDEFRNSFNNDHLLQRELMSFKGDLEAIKGLLLNRFVYAEGQTSRSYPSFY